jgi:HTH-type transcriptional regulator, sugar sensing transcriptional regulator
MSEYMLSSSLKEIGLTDGEMRVYLALLELGSSSTGNITRKSRISGSKVYEVLDRLKAKGLASETVINGVKYFEASNPARIIDYLEEKENLISAEKQVAHKILPELLLRWKTTKKSEVKIYLGFEGLKTANEDIISTLKKGEEWLSMGLSDQPQSWEIYFNKRQEVRAKKGIIHKHLINEKYKSLHQKRKGLAFTEFRFLPKELEMPTSTEIYKDKVIIMVIAPDNPMAIMIESRAVAESFRKYFKVMWNNCKRT